MKHDKLAVILRAATISVPALGIADDDDELEYEAAIKIVKSL